MTTTVWVIAAASFVLALGGTAAMRRYARWRRLLDHPNERSSHAQPTPRGGGLAIVAAFVLGASLFALPAGEPQVARLWVALVPPALAVAAVGFWDDHRPLTARVRLLVHFGAAIWLVAALGGLAPLRLGQQTIDLGWVGAGLAVVAVVWVLNLYNFMDGIDGIAAGEAVFVALAGAVLVGPGATPFAPLVILAGSAAGFLVLNWPPARIFMGDVGSGFLGFTIAGLLLAGHNAGQLPPAVPLILLAVFLVDASWTLVRRLLRREPVHQPHRMHAYQRAARRFAAHRPVTAAVLLIDLAWLLPAALLAVRRPEWSLAIAGLAAVPVLLLAWWLGAGLPEAPRATAPGPPEA